MDIQRFWKKTLSPRWQRWIISPWQKWLTPRSTDHDEAFRERTIRAIIPILVFITLAVYTRQFIVDPTLTTLLVQLAEGSVVFALLGGLTYAVTKGKITFAGQVITVLFVVGVFFMMIDDGYWSNDVHSMKLLVPLVAALVLPINLLIPATVTTVVVFAVVAIGQDLSGRVAPVIDGKPLDTVWAAILDTFFLMMIEAVLLRYMRVEFDRRLRVISETAQNLRIATAKAKEASRTKSEFLANVSHELRTPLNAIIGFSDMLLMGMSGDLNESQRHKVERLKENGNRLLSLVNNILDITRIEAKRIEIINKPFSPRALIKRLQSQMEPLARQSGLEFNATVDEAIPETLLGDEVRVEQVITNLLSNAFKFTPKGSVSVNIRINPGDKTWSVVVADTGIGIAPHAQEIIFEEFRQVDGSFTRAYKGSGLGLAIARNLVRIMSGEIKVESELGKGSTFTVTLPLLQEVREPQLEMVEA